MAPQGFPLYRTPPHAQVRRRAVAAAPCRSGNSTGAAASATGAAVGIGGVVPRSAATSRSNWKTRAVTAASCASRRWVRSSPGGLLGLSCGPSLMSLYSTQPAPVEQSMGPPALTRTVPQGNSLRRCSTLERHPAQKSKIIAIAPPIPCWAPCPTNDATSKALPYYATVGADPQPAHTGLKNSGQRDT